MLNSRPLNSRPLDLKTPKFTVNVVTGKGGGGHYATYHALEYLAKRRGLPWKFQVTDMDDILKAMTENQGNLNVYKCLGISGTDLYNSMLKHGWTWLWPLQMRMSKLLIKRNFRFAVDYFKRYWQQQRPDIVLSVVTMCNRVLWQALYETLPGTSYVTVMTDFADTPPGYWIEPETNSYLVCGKQYAVQQALALGVSQGKIIATSGMVIHPKFRPPDDEDQWDITQARVEKGLHPNRLTGLVMFGGNGAKAMVDIAKALNGLGDHIQLIFLCGYSEDIFDQLNNLPSAQHHLVVKFTSVVADYMALSDFFIGKPGPGSLSEALAMNLPVITERNFSTLLQERYNADWIEQKGMGIVLRSFSNVASAVEQFLDPPTFERYQNNVRADDNYAVEEVCDLISALLEN